MAVMRCFKTTEIGAIPSDWSLCSLSEVAEVRGGIAKNSNQLVEDPVEVAYLRVANVQDGYLDLADLSTIEISKQDLKRFSVLPGDVLMNEGGDLNKLGRGAVWRGLEEPCVHQNHVFVVRCKPRLVPEYLDIWTGTPTARKFFLLAGKQTTNLASISKSSLGKLPVALPSTQEQQAIAAAINDMDKLIASLEQMISKKRATKAAAMQQLLTGKTRLPGFTGNWKTRRLGEVGAIYGGLVGKSKAHFGYGSSKYVTFMNVMSNIIITNDVFDCIQVDETENQNRVLRGDILFNGSSETPEEVGMCALMDFDAKNIYLNSFCFGFRLTADADTNPLFLTYYIRSAYGRSLMKSLAQGSTRYNLPKSAFLKIQLRLPPFSEQSSIASALSDMDMDIEAIEARLTKLLTIKQGMMQELLTGRTRLI